jgi:hypothetical protein
MPKKIAIYEKMEPTPIKTFKVVINKSPERVRNENPTRGRNKWPSRNE